MTITAFPNGVSSYGVPVVPGAERGANVFGKTYFVDSTNGSDGNSGLGAAAGLAFASITKAFSTMSNRDAVFLAPGGYAGNYNTPLNATASFCSFIGTRATDLGIGAWASASTASSPVINVRARGWRFSGFEFDCPTGSSGLKLTKSADGSTSRPDFIQADNCLFTLGKAGIEFAGGGTYFRILNNQFSLINTAGGAAIWVSSSGFQVPQKGIIEHNAFDNNVNHIETNPQGFMDTVIRGNVFQADGNTTDATILMDIRGSAGNSVVGNYFDLAKTDFNAAATLIRASSTDFGAGNWFKDGAQDIELGA